MHNLDRIRQNHAFIRGACTVGALVIGVSNLSFLWGLPIIAVVWWSYNRVEKLEQGLY